MKVFDILQEGGIKTAKLDTAAHRALMKAFPHVISQIITKAEAEVPPKKPDPEYSDSYDVSAHYDNLYQLFYKEKNRLVVPICMEAGNILTEITKNHLREIKDTIVKPYWEVLFDDIVKNVRVQVEAREMSTDDYRDYGGYYSHHQNLLKVFVNREQVHDAALELVAEHIVGESERQGLYNLTGTVVPVFVHEYAHMEQAIKTKKPTKDFGYITVGTKERGRRGRRGGYMRTPRESLAAALRYRGNLDEIDSFASDAVAELMHEFHSRPSWKTSDINSQIKNIRENLTYGYSSGSKTFDYYSYLLKSTFEGAYDELGLNPKQMEKVWKRFAKRVYDKLGDYLIPMIGKARETDLQRINPEWTDWIKTQPIREVIVSMARQQAKNIADKSYNIDKTIENIQKGYSETDRAEQFLELYYLGETWTETPAAQRLATAYRNLVVKFIRKYQ